VTEATRQPPTAVQPVVDADPPVVRADSAVVLDTASGRILIGSRPHERVPIASTTKIMTAVALLNSGRSLDTVVSVSQAAASQIGSSMGLQPGDELSLRDLLAGLLIVSGNDAAMAIAETFGGQGPFVERMNEEAAGFGLADTHYADPAGLDDTGRSSAVDLAQLLRYALTFAEFRKFVRTAEMTIETDHGRRFSLKTSNRLITPDEPLYLADVVGGKTGFTPEAGHSLVTAAERDGHVLVVAVLHTNEDTPEASAKEARRLLEWSFAHTAWNP
jgi:D-alanyl-D-alanine carboxypeptidase